MCYGWGFQLIVGAQLAHQVEYYEVKWCSVGEIGAILRTCALLFPTLMLWKLVFQLRISATYEALTEAGCQVITKQRMKKREEMIRHGTMRE